MPALLILAVYVVGWLVAAVVLTRWLARMTKPAEYDLFTAFGGTGWGLFWPVIVLVGVPAFVVLKIARRYD